MKCPFCKGDGTRVTDSRLSDNGESVRRRRECEECGARFTSYERVELDMPRIIKADGAREMFLEDKLRSGLYRALEKRPVESQRIDEAISNIKKKIIALGEREVTSNSIGEIVMDELRGIDEVAYVRFASVYRSFQDLDAFRAEIDRVLDKGNK